MVVMYEGGYPNEIPLERMREKAPVFVKNQLTTFDFLMESITPFYRHADNFFDFSYKDERTRYHYRQDKSLTTDVVISNLVRFSDMCSFGPVTKADQELLTRSSLSSYFSHNRIEFNRSIFYPKYQDRIDFNPRNPFYKTTLNQCFLDNIALFFSYPIWGMKININMSFMLQKKASFFSFFRPSFEPKEISCSLDFLIVAPYSSHSSKSLSFSYDTDKDTINALINEKVRSLLNLSFNIDFFAEKEDFARYIDLFEMEII